MLDKGKKALRAVGKISQEKAPNLRATAKKRTYVESIDQPRKVVGLREVGGCVTGKKKGDAGTKGLSTQWTLGGLVDLIKYKFHFSENA